MTKAANAISRLAVAIAGVGIVLMLVLVVADVVLRATFNMAIPGNDTIVASYLMVAAIFLPLALLQMLDENIAVEALYDRCPAVLRDVFDLLAHVLTLAFYLILGWVYAEVAVEAFAVKEFVTGTWNVPIWPARVFMPAGLFLGAFAAAVKAVQAARYMRAGAPPPPHDTPGAF
ncbi:TRAP transporter small permease [Celeribacter indicus]|uniref:TRAP transporter small permease protein n=1 Tax=Celeribacter indicus TaxID=1208324 RepID=A0A0B5DTP6_9RHOB|nr:TRAP transporter small permease [Celeribacter indicus]AJE46803.1 hypothetical protein P73_2088 [Celeribacter indicus]SDW81547.1 TRAP-type mannitol/chloroaromatic compound transport system, small permease component [Celeribacter indicus]